MTRERRRILRYLVYILSVAPIYGALFAVVELAGGQLSAAFGPPLAGVISPVASRWGLWLRYDRPSRADRRRILQARDDAVSSGDPRLDEIAIDMLKNASRGARLNVALAGVVAVGVFVVTGLAVWRVSAWWLFLAVPHIALAGLYLRRPVSWRSPAQRLAALRAGGALNAA